MTDTVGFLLGYYLPEFFGTLVELSAMYKPDMCPKSSSVYNMIGSLFTTAHNIPGNSNAPYGADDQDFVDEIPAEFRVPELSTDIATTSDDDDGGGSVDADHAVSASLDPNALDKDGKSRALSHFAEGEGTGSFPSETGFGQSPSGSLNQHATTPSDFNAKSPNYQGGSRGLGRGSF